MRRNTIPKTCPPLAVWRASLSDNMMVSDTTDAPAELTHMTQISSVVWKCSAAGGLRCV